MIRINHLDDTSLLSIFEFCDVLELVRCEYSCKRWNSLIRCPSNAFVNHMWRKRYNNLCDSYYSNTLQHQQQLDWRGKSADIYPIMKKEITNKEKVIINDIYYEKLRLCCRAGHTATLIDDDIIILFGGASHLFMFTNTCDIISLKQMKILSVSRMPENAPTPRWLHTASTLNNNIIIFGGQSDNGLENDLYLMTHNISESGVMNICFSTLPCLGYTIPSPRGGHSMIIDEIKLKLILFGGMISGQICSNDMYSLHLEEVHHSDNHVKQQAIWTYIKPIGRPPAPRWCHSSCLIDRNMFIFGGWRYVSTIGMRHEFLNDLFLFHLDTYTWVQIETTGIPPSPRCQAPCWRVPSTQCATSQGYLILYGGACHSEQEVVNTAVQPPNAAVMDLGDLHILDLDTCTWLPWSYSFPRCRGGTNAILYTPKGWLLSGGMHSETVAHTPRFKNDLVELRPNLGGCNNISPSVQMREDLRIASRFIFFVDAK